MHGKRYKESSGYRRGREVKIWPRILLTVCGAVAFAVAFCYVGIILGQKADEGVLPSDTSSEVATSLESEKVTEPAFVFKDVGFRKSACSEIAENEAAVYDTVLVRLTDGEGKLKYLSAVSSLIYGSQFSTTLKPISAAVNDANIKANAVSLSFAPFKADKENGKNSDYADMCTLMLIKELCDQKASEILIEGHELSEKLISEASGYVAERETVKLGVMLPSSIFDKHEYEQEEILKKYYSAFDFCVMDLSDAVIDLPTESETGDATEAGYNELYRIVTENSLIIAKYSLRLRFCVNDSIELEEVNKLIYELGIENYEIVSE